MSAPVTMYATSWCGHCRRLKRQLDDAGVSYRVVDVDDVPEVGARIEAHTGGYRTVPSLDVGGELLVNPSVSEVLQALQAS